MEESTAYEAVQALSKVHVVGRCTTYWQESYSAVGEAFSFPTVIGCIVPVCSQSCKSQIILGILLPLTGAFDVPTDLLESQRSRFLATLIVEEARC